MPLHPYEPEDAYGANSLENSTVQSGPINRIRWGTHKPSPAQGRKKRASIMRRWSKHKRAQSDQSEQSDGSDGLDSVGTGGAGATRTIYFNQPLPPEAKDEDGRPLMQYKRNKTRTAKYTPLSFIPKNLWLQFHNIANIYFLFIICLSVCTERVMSKDFILTSSRPGKSLAAKTRDLMLLRCLSFFS